MTRFRKIMLGAVFFLMILLTLLSVFFPFESHFVTGRFELFFSGVKSFQSEGFSGLLRDTCDPQDPEARGCTCVALIHGLGDDETTWTKLLTAPKIAWVKPVRLYAFAMSRNRRFLRGENPVDYEAHVQARALEKALASLCASWVVVGNSLGGWESAWMALDHQLKIDKLILVDSAGLRSVTENRAVELFTHPTVENVHEFFSLLYFKSPKLSRLGWWKTSEILTSANLGEVIGAQKEDDLLDGRLGALSVPTLLFWGAGDRLIPVSIGHEMRRLIPNAIWREIPRCGHLPQQECPEALIQAINDALR